MTQLSFCKHYWRLDLVGYADPQTATCKICGAEREDPSLDVQLRTVEHSWYYDNGDEEHYEQQCLLGAKNRLAKGA